jgi:hypothetical protein
MARQSWLDAATKEPLIHDYTQQLTTFIDALADGKIDDSELSAQQARLTALLEEIEPQLDDSLHASVTKLLCELTASNIMHTLYSLQQARPVSAFRG